MAEKGKRMPFILEKWLTDKETWLDRTLHMEVCIVSFAQMKEYGINRFFVGKRFLSNPTHENLERLRIENPNRKVFVLNTWY